MLFTVTISSFEPEVLYLVHAQWNCPLVVPFRYRQLVRPSPCSQMLPVVLQLRRCHTDLSGILASIMGFGFGVRGFGVRV